MLRFLKLLALRTIIDRSAQIRLFYNYPAATRAGGFPGIFGEYDRIPAAVAQKIGLGIPAPAFGHGPEGLFYRMEQCFFFGICQGKDLPSGMYGSVE